MAKADRVYYLAQALLALRRGDILEAGNLLLLSEQASEDAAWWWASTKIELLGHTEPFSGKTHSDMHTPPVWNALPAFCKTR